MCALYIICGLELTNLTLKISYEGRCLCPKVVKPHISMHLWLWQQRATGNHFSIPLPQPAALAPGAKRAKVSSSSGSLGQKVPMTKCTWRKAHSAPSHNL